MTTTKQFILNMTRIASFVRPQEIARLYNNLSETVTRRQNEKATLLRTSAISPWQLKCDLGSLLFAI